MRDHCGWRARIGLIYMASSTVMEPEFHAMSPEGVATCTTRIHLPKPTVSGLGAMMESDDVERCTASLAGADLHVIAFGGTSATFLNGPGWDRKINERMSSASAGLPVTVAHCFDVLNKGGKIVLFGVTDPAVKIDFSPYQVFRNEITVLGSLMTNDSLPRTLQLIASEKLRVQPLISHILPLERFYDALVMHEKQEGIKILIHPET